MAKWWHSDVRRERDTLLAEREALGRVLPVAQELVARVAAHPLDEDHVREVAGALESKELQRRTLGALDHLPPDERYAILAGVMGDEALQKLLADRHAAAARQEAFHGRIKTLAAEGRAYDSIDLSGAPVRATLNMELFSADDFVEVSGRLSDLVDDKEPQRFLSVNARGGGLFTVVTDLLLDDATRGYPRLDDHEVVRLGSYGPAEGDAETVTPIEPILYLGGAVACGADDEPELLGVRTHERTMTDLVLGRLTINNHLVLGAANAWR